MKGYFATNGLNGMRDDLVAYAMAHQIADEELREAITGAVSMDLEKIRKFIEFVYRQGKNDRDAELAQIAAGAAVVMNSSGFLEMGKDGTALGIALALLRDVGEPAAPGSPWPEPEKDPVLPEPQPAPGTPAAS